MKAKIKGAPGKGGKDILAELDRAIVEEFGVEMLRRVEAEERRRQRKERDRNRRVAR